MPEEATLTPPAPTPSAPSPAPTGTAAPAAQPTPTASAGTPPPAAQPPTPKPTAAERAASHIEKVLGKPKEAAKVDPAKPDDEDIEGLTDDEKKTAKSHPGAWKVLRGQEKKWKEKHASLQSKITELSNKPALSQADTEKLARLEKQLADREKEFTELKSKAAESDYSLTEPYKKLIAEWNDTYREAYSYMAGLNVLDEDGNIVRKATPDDFNELANLNLQGRRKMARTMFGEDAMIDVVDYTKTLDRIKASSEKGKAEHAANYEKTNAERTTAAERERQAYGQMLQDASKEIEKRYPDLFSPDHYADKPELQQALREGYEFLDKAEQDATEMVPEDRAALTAIIRARAAGWVLMHKERASDKAEIESLKAELAKYRGSDPGAVTAKPVTPVTEPEVGSMAEMARRVVQEA